jgi:hypothetical protein
MIQREKNVPANYNSAWGFPVVETTSRARWSICVPASSPRAHSLFFLKKTGALSFIKREKRITT